MILSAEFAKGFVRQYAAAKKASAALGVGGSGRDEGSVRIRGAVGVRGAEKEAGAVSAVETRPNQSLEPTRMLVTDRAFARSAPSTRVAHL